MLRITDPFHGAILNAHHGTVRDNALHVTVRGDCPAYGEVSVNGVPATIAGGQFTAVVPVTAREQDIVASYRGSYGHLQHAVRVVWDRHSFPRYRFSIDDNSFFLRDIARKQYASLFDCFYLDFLRRLHREYGTKFTVNIYFKTDDNPQDEFVLTEFPDRYRGEWEANADWLGLTFHAYSNLPDRPYQYAPAEKLLSDMALVEEQIVRFAGPQTLIPETVIHWAMVLPEAYRPLYDHGVRVLSGFFSRWPAGWDINYNLDDVRTEYLSNHDCLMDWDSGLVFSRCDIVCNNTPPEQVDAVLGSLAADPNHAQIMDLFTHEQYFWDFYPNYLPDHPQRVETAIRWVTDRGYQPVFFHEGFLGAPQ